MTAQIQKPISSRRYKDLRLLFAFLAQVVEQLTRNEQVAGSSPVEGSGLILITHY